MDISPHPAWQRAEKLLESKAWLIALGIVALGLYLRWDKFGEFWLNPDEGIDYSAATSASWERIKQEVTGNAHPPFFYVLLRGFAWFGHDFMILRLPSLIFGCLAIHGMYLAGRAFSGPLAGLVSAFFLALMPSVIVQSQIIRPYMVLLACLLYGLAFLGRYLMGKGGRNLIWYSVSMLFAILSHYSAFLVLGSLALMFAAMVVLKALQPRQIRDLILASLVPAVAMVLLYLLHIRPTLQGGDLQAQALETWMSSFMISDSGEAWHNTQGLLRYLFGFRHAGTVFLILCGGLALSIERHKTFIYGLPAASLVIALGLSFTSFYPYGDSRHSIYLITFLLLPIGYGISQALLSGPRPAMITSAALIVLLAIPAIGNFIMVGGRQRVRFLEERLSTMTGFAEVVAPRIAALRERDGVLILNVQSFYLLLPLFVEAREEVHWIGEHPNSYQIFPWGKCTVVVSREWDMSADLVFKDRKESLAHFLTLLDKYSPELEVRNRTDAWIMVGGWNMPLADQLINLHVGRGQNLLHHNFKLADRLSQATANKRLIPSFLGFQIDLKRYSELLSGG